MTIDIDNAEGGALISYYSVTWDYCYQYNNFNMPDAFSILPYRTKPLSMTGLGMHY